MKQLKLNKKIRAKGLALAILLSGSLAGFSQDRAAIVDLKMGSINLTDDAGNPVNLNSIYLNEVLKLSIPLSSVNHGKDIPAGSLKIKIGLGSKIELDRTFHLNSATSNNYFRWIHTVSGGQTLVIGELINKIPAGVESIDLGIRVKTNEAGHSTITANYLVTNHNTNVILSDENGGNNTAFVEYQVSDKVAPPVDVVNDGKLEVSLYPNPVTNSNVLVINASRGRFDGKYNIVMVDMNGKTIQSGDFSLQGAKRIDYRIGMLAAGKYLLRLIHSDGSQSFVLPFEKL
jgi:hypothetical protein